MAQEGQVYGDDSEDAPKFVGGGNSGDARSFIGGGDPEDARKFVREGDSGDASSLKGGTLSPQLPPQSGSETVGGVQRQGGKRKTAKISEADQPAYKKGKSIKDAEYRERKREAQLKIEKEKNDLESENQKLKREIEKLKSDNSRFEKNILELEGKVTKIELEGENRALRLQNELLNLKNEKKDLQRDLEIAKQCVMAQPEQHPFYNQMAQSGQLPFYDQLAQPGQLPLHNPLAQPGQLLPYNQLVQPGQLQINNQLAQTGLLRLPNQLPLPQPVQLQLNNQLPQPAQLSYSDLLPQHESESRISGSPPKPGQRLSPRTVQPEEGFTNSNSSSTMPPLSSEPKLEQSAYCKMLFQKYEKLDDRLKLCLLSFAVYPENAEVKKTVLRNWWVGEGLAPDEGEEKFADEILKKFVEMEFIEPVNRKHRLSTSSYRMYPIVRSAVIIQARKEQLFVYDHYQNPTMDFSKCYKACLVKAEEESKFIELGKLETLFNVSDQFPDLKEECFSKMKRIRVLCLGRWESTTDRHTEVNSTICLKGLSKMKNLRFLSLQGISGIKTLPNSFCQAAKLRILNLRACHNLEELPDNIGSLKKLTYVDISDCCLLDQMPKELSSLSELKVLKGFVISEHVKSCSLDDLAALKKLEKLSISIIQKYYLPKQLSTAIPKFESLKNLKISWGGAKLTAGAEEEESEELSSREKPTGDEIKQKKIAKKRRENRKKDSDAAQSTVANQCKQEEIKEDRRNKSDAVQSTLNMGKAENEIKLDKERSIKIAGAENGDRSKDNTKPWGIELIKNAVRATRLSMQKPWSVVKLELQCYPETTPPSWLAPEFLHRLEKLYIKGGRLHKLPKTGAKWTVKILHLKYLSDLKIDWKELREMFPNLEYFESETLKLCSALATGWMVPWHFSGLLKNEV